MKEIQKKKRRRRGERVFSAITTDLRRITSYTDEVEQTPQLHFKAQAVFGERK